MNRLPTLLPLGGKSLTHRIAHQHPYHHSPTITSSQQAIIRRNNSPSYSKTEQQGTHRHHHYDTATVHPSQSTFATRTSWSATPPTQPHPTTLATQSGPTHHLPSHMIASTTPATVTANKQGTNHEDAFHYRPRQRQSVCAPFSVHVCANPSVSRVPPHTPSSPASTATTASSHQQHRHNVAKQSTIDLQQSSCLPHLQQASSSTILPHSNRHQNNPPLK